MKQEAASAGHAADHGVTLEELLLEEGEDFIDAAYEALLNRRPDASGGPRYLSALRDGTSKLAILYELYSSTESRRLGIEMSGLLDAFASEGIGEMAGVARQAAAIQSAEQLLILQEPDEFIALAYRVLLKRPADTQGIVNYKKRLQEGIGRAAILHELFLSPERQRVGTELPGLREAFRREGLPLPESDGQIKPALVKAAQDLTELLRYEGALFVECAHLTLLKRQPEEVVLYRQAARIRAGESKLQLLSEIARAREAAPAVHRLPGLSRALRLYRFGAVPVLGAIVRVLARTESNRAPERARRAAEQRIFSLEVALALQIERLEKAGEKADLMAQQSLATIADMGVRVASLERSCAALRKLTTRYVDDAQELDPPPPEDLPRAPSVRLAVEARAEEIFRDLRRTET